MTKFKKGDVVTPAPVNGEIHTWLVRGNKYVVKSCYAEGLIDVEGEFNKPGNRFGWSTDWFELAEKEGVKVENTMTAEYLRKSILSLQQERVSLQEKIEQNITQEKSLTEQLKGLGFLLVEANVVDKKKAMLYAEDIKADMTDPENWEVGDMIQCVNGKGWEHWIDEGEIAEMVEPLSPQLHLKTKYGMKDFGSFYYEDFKFHSRPVK